MRKPVWLFSEGSLKRRDLLGNKGANLCEMTSLGMPVPFGFIITTQTHLEYQRLRQRIPEGTMEEVKAALLKMEIRQGAEFGNPVNPLLVSVRSGASVSMPGMMDTLLNLFFHRIGIDYVSCSPHLVPIARLTTAKASI
jgi:Phosphoenolpyruvate synthase/pyruvate phosphate dikinase